MMKIKSSVPGKGKVLNKCSLYIFYCVFICIEKITSVNKNIISDYQGLWIHFFWFVFCLIVFHNLSIKEWGKIHKVFLEALIHFCSDFQSDILLVGNDIQIVALSNVLSNGKNVLFLYLYFPMQ